MHNKTTVILKTLTGVQRSKARYCCYLWASCGKGSTDATNQSSDLTNICGIDDGQPVPEPGREVHHIGSGGGYAGPEYTQHSYVLAHEEITLCWSAAY